ncbi:hypothetical protein V6N13_106842 [Hibiscus sabdariffa]
MRKGNQSVVAKPPRAFNIREPIITSLNDYPIISRSVSKAGSLRNARASYNAITLDKSLHSTIVLPENSNPNLQSDTSNRDIPPSRKNGHVMGDPPDSDMELLPTPLLLGLGHE